jgi:hypothetical protein
MHMLKGLGLPLALTCALSCGLAEIAAGAILNGKLSVRDGGIVAGGAWNDPNTIFSWKVTAPAQTPGGEWRYEYTFTVPHPEPGGWCSLCGCGWSGSTATDPGIDRLLVELRFQVLIGDLVNKSWTGQEGQTAQVRLYTPSGDGTVLPDLPGDAYGIKFNITGAPTTVVAEFDTAHSPTWGDFYVCGGLAGPAAWNEGFTLIDPNDPPADGSILNHILVPGPGTEIPEPSVAALLLAGALLCLRRRPG